MEMKPEDLIELRDVLNKLSENDKLAANTSAALVKLTDSICDKIRTIEGNLEVHAKLINQLKEERMVEKENEKPSGEDAPDIQAALATALATYIVEDVVKKSNTDRLVEVLKLTPVDVLRHGLSFKC